MSMPIEYISLGISETTEKGVSFGQTNHLKVFFLDFKLNYILGKHSIYGNTCDEPNTKQF